MLREAWMSPWQRARIIFCVVHVNASCEAAVQTVASVKYTFI